MSKNIDKILALIDEALGEPPVTSVRLSTGDPTEPEPEPAETDDPNRKAA